MTLEPKFSKDVSFVIPVYNGADTITDTLRSIVIPSDLTGEIVVVNDGSSDDTAAILNGIINQIPGLIVLTNRRNRGIVFSLNRGLRQCQGRFVFRLDADDTSHPDRVRQMCAYMDHHNLALAGSAVNLIGATGERKGISMRLSTPWANRAFVFLGAPFVHPSVVFDRQKLPRFKYKMGWDGIEDWVLWWDLRHFSMGNCPQPLINYALGPVHSATGKRTPHLGRQKLAAQFFILRNTGCQVTLPKACIGPIFLLRRMGMAALKLAVQCVSALSK